MVYKTGTLRIIGGYWRRRKIPILNIPGVRPTSDRIRETLFNWLMPYIEGANCLDLFAGSGALGFEALSRGAAQVSFVDSSGDVVDQIKRVAKNLGIPTKQIEVIQGSCFDDVSLSFYPYDIVFLDPPFHDKRLPEIFAWLESNAYLTQSGLIYVEMETERKSVVFPAWHCLKEGHTSKISYYLLQQERS